MGDPGREAEQFRRARGVRFRAARAAALYAHRPPYAGEVLDVLTGLVRGVGPLLDVGTGPGKLARALALRGFAVDAVDPSAEMIRAGRALPGGDHPALRWHEDRLEDAPLEPGYVLAVAGASFHWLDPDVALPRLAGLLAPGARLAVLDGDRAWQPPWAEAEREVMIDFVTRIEGVAPVWRETPLEETRLVRHPAFALEGAVTTAPAPFRQRLDDYVACQHSRATFTHEVMGPLAEAFDDALGRALAPFARGGWLHYVRRTRVEWGAPSLREGA